MEWLTAFQHSLRGPVFGLLGTWWPLLAAIGLGLAGWYFSDFLRGRGDGGATIVGDMDADGDSSSDGGGH